MISYVLPAIWSVSILNHIRQKRNIVGLIFLSLLMSPTLAVGEQRISSMYYFCFFLGVLILNKHIAINRNIVKYLLELIVLILVYVIGWFLNGTGGILVGLLGDLKFIILIFEVMILVRDCSRESIEEGFLWATNFSVIINFVVIVTAFIDPFRVTKVVEYFFYNDDTINASSNIVDGTLSRAYGVFNHPAALAVFCLTALAFYSVHIRKHKGCLFYFLACIFMGIFSYSKTFILGLPIVLLVWVLYNLKRTGNSTLAWLILGCVCIGALFFININWITELIRKDNPVLAYYMDYIKAPLKALSTRYSQKEGNLAPMYEVIKRHPFIGVGVNPIANEEVLDSAPLVILHNGGAVALCLVLIIYIQIIIEVIGRHLEEGLYFIVIVLMSGLALPTWVFHSSSMAVILYIFMQISCRVDDRREFVKLYN